ncbi:MAG: hypothetical protein VXV91_08770, partial [Verrucomicrobiota bacterium]|nr:hypothetical protein [Verrucomicrobiota bacterium]
WLSAIVWRGPPQIAWLGRSGFGAMVSCGFARVLGFPFQGGMSEGLFQLGELWLVVLHGCFAPGFGRIDEIV